GRPRPRAVVEEPAAVLLLDDAPRQREPHPPPPRLGADARLEQPGPPRPRAPRPVLAPGGARRGAIAPRFHRAPHPAPPPPRPPGLVLTPGSNGWARTAAAIPGPSSRTETRAAARSLPASTRTSTRPPRPLKASTAFLTSASSAHSTNTGSPATVGPGPAAWSVKVTGFASVGSRCWK